MVTAKDVAEWMFQKLEETGYLSQGSDFVCQNDNGNLAINKEVLKEFRNFIKDKFEWDRSEKAWRKINF